MTNFRSITSVYNPDLLSKDQLIDSYVVRLKKFDKLFADIKTADMEKPEQHLMLVGLRGMGKTTLLRRLAYEVENDPGLNTWLVPIIFNEEEYGINQLFKLWETIAKYLEKRDVAFVGLFSEMDQIYTRLKDDVHRYEQEAFELLLERLHQHQKKLLLFIDNFGDMFKRFTKKNEKQRLREILMTCADLRIIAASAVVMEAFFKYDDPLYEFFKIERLEGLDFEETKTLLLKLGAHIPDNPIQKIIDEQPQRIEALRRLTGGIPRSMVLFFDIFIKDKDGTALTDLEKILDYVTPLYKQRMDDLPSQQQDIMQTLALNYDGMSAREIADRTRLSSKLVSAQLNQLQKDNLVSVANEGSKNHIYHVYDRFFNIWFLMRMARSGDKNRILWLVRFLEAWCTPEDLAKRSEAHRDAMAMTFYDPRAAYTFSSALYYADNQDIDGRYLMARRTQDYLRHNAPDLFEQSKASDIVLFAEGVTQMKLHNWENAYLSLIKLQDRNMQDALILSVLEKIRGNSTAAEKWIQEANNLNFKNASLNSLIGQIYQYLVDDFEEAASYFQKAIEDGDNKAYHYLGHLYRQTRKYDLAKNYLSTCARLGDGDAWLGLGDMCRYQLNELVEAEECYLMGASIGNSDCYISLGDIYFYRDFPETDIEKTKQFYLKAIGAGNKKGWLKIGDLYSYYDYKLAIDFYKRSIREGQQDAWYGLAEIHARKKNDYELKQCLDSIKANQFEFYSTKLAHLYEYVLDEPDEAEKYYLKAVDIGEDNCWGSLGSFYDHRKLYDKAQEAFLKGISKGEISCYYALAILNQNAYKDFDKSIFYLKKYCAYNEGDWAFSSLGDAYYYFLNDAENAEIYYMKAIEKGFLNTWLNLAIMYKSLNNWEKVDFFYRKAIDYDKSNVYLFLDTLFLFKKNPKEALSIINDLDSSHLERHQSIIIACIYLWNDIFDMSFEFANNFLHDNSLFPLENIDKERVTKYFILLLSKSQYEFLYNYFTSERGQSLQLKDHLLPIYYALMHYLKDEYPQEYLRTPPELKETVQEIMDKVEEYRIVYQLPPEEAATA